MAKKTSSPWDEVEAVPRSDIKIGKRGRFQSRALRGALYLALILGIIAAYFAIDTAVFGGGDEESAKTAASLESNPGQGEARVALESWVEKQEDEGGIQGARLLGWSSSEAVPDMSSETVAAFSHTFSVETSNLGVIEVRQIVFQDVTSGSVTASTQPPSLDAFDTAGTVEGPDQSWVGFAPAKSDQGAESAITAWARAYTSGDSESLRVTMRDQDTSHVYPALTGVGAVEVNILEVAHRDLDGDASKKELDEAESWAVARVEVTVLWTEDGEPLGGSDAEASDGGGELPAVVDGGEESSKPSGDAAGTTFTVDIRLTDMEGGTPTVTAWGAAGTGPSLTDFENAYVASS